MSDTLAGRIALVIGSSSDIGLAEGAGPSGLWSKTPHEFAAREDRFDSGQLSPGPLWHADVQRPVMFYNGATHDAQWAIGWVRFDHANNAAAGRCEAPLIAPPGGERGRNMAFAAFLLPIDEELHPYFTVNDRAPKRATIRPIGAR